ncbi:MAG: pentapeptide repeat-containing protein [Pseudomonadota bacterium]
MADHEHLEVIREGVSAWNSWRDNNPNIIPNLSDADLSDADLSDADFMPADLSGANLIAADLSGADLSGANLSGANLSGANLSGVDLCRTNLSGANLHRANISDADLMGADLSGANLIAADLSGADLSATELSSANLRAANLSRAILQLANLSGAELKRANLESCDLRGSWGMEVDDNYIHHANFGPNAYDKWSILRRTYTGPNMVINLLFVALFFAPLMLRASGLGALSEIQAEALVDSGVIGQSPVETCARTGLMENPIATGETIACRTRFVWEIMLGSESPFHPYMTWLTIVLIGYQTLRYWVTVRVSMMRDVEERSGVSPEYFSLGDVRRSEVTSPRRLTRNKRFLGDYLGSYSFLYRIHQILTVVFWIAATTFLIQFYNVATGKVVLPSAG